MTTDIDRLHDVIDGKLVYRGCGKTYAQCHQIVGFVDLDELYVTCAVDYVHDLYHIWPMLQEVAEEAGHQFEHIGPNAVRIGSTDVRAVSTKGPDWGRQLRGRSGPLIHMRR